MKKYKRKSKKSVFYTIVFYCTVMIFITNCGIFGDLDNGGISTDVDPTICNHLKVDFPETESGSCCRKLAIINNSPEGAYLSASIPFSFSLTTYNGQIVSGGNSQEDVLVNSTPNQLTWANFSTGRVELGEICFDNNHGGNIDFEWKNILDQSLCTDNIDVYCGDNDISLKENCCSFNVYLVNTDKDDLEAAKVRITSLDGTKIINFDPDDWEVVESDLNYVEWKPNSELIPGGTAITNDFVLYTESTELIQAFRVDWYNSNNEIICQHNVELSCIDDYDPDTDWRNFTSTTSIDDSRYFIFFEKDEISEDCGADDVFKTDCITDFEYKITCENSVYSLNLFGPDGFEFYYWEVTHDDQVTEREGKNPASVTLNGSGYYSISFNAEGDNDICMSSKDGSISSFNPDFAFEKEPCEFLFNFKALGISDLSQVEKIKWSCEEVSDFSEEGVNISYSFSEVGDYTVKMNIIDIYGCEHYISKIVTVSSECLPEFLFSYNLCAEDCISNSGTNTINIGFKNISDGGVCPVTYTWDFGGDNIITTIDKTDVSHTIPISDCKRRFDVTLTMEDALGCSKTYTKNIYINPVDPQLSVSSCPDGKIKLEANMVGVWTAPGGNIQAGDYNSETAYYDEYTDTELNDCVIISYNQSGSYQVHFEGYDELSKGRCEITKTIDIEIDCCAKNDKLKRTFGFTVDDKHYKMKMVFVQRQLPAVHHVKAKTKLRKRRKFPFPSNWTYYSPTKADEIYAAVSGEIYTRDESANVTCSNSGGGCNSLTP